MALTKILTEGIKDGEIVNADINASAAIATSKISGLATSATTDTTNASNIGSGSLANARLTKPIDFADNEKARFGTGNDLEIYHNGSHTYIADTGTGQLRISSDELRINNAANSETMIAANQNQGVELYYDASKKFETTSIGATITGSLSTTGNVTPTGYMKLVDSMPLYVGTGNDLQIYHDGSNSRIADAGTGHLILTSNGAGVLIQDYSSGQNMAKFLNGGAVELYHNYSKKFETFGSGCKLYSQSGAARLEIQGAEGSGAWLQIQADDGDDNADYWRMYAGTNADFYLQNYKDGAWETSLDATGGGNIRLMYDNSKKLETTSAGVSVTGTLTASGSIETTGSELKITGAEPRLTFTDTDNNPDFQIWANAQKFAIYDSTNGASRLHIDSSGNVGIGLTNPGSYDSQANQLVVYGAGHAGMTIRGNYANSGNIYFADGTSGGEKYDGFISYSWPTARLAFGAGGTTRVKVTTDGLCFGSDTASSNALDDYEEGTFDAINNYNTVWYSNENKCSYTKIGRQVTVTGQIRAYSGSGDVKLGLPFNTASGTEGEFKGAGALNTYAQDWPTGTSIGVLIEQNVAYVYPGITNQDDGGWNVFQTDAGGYFRFTFTYFTS